MHAYQIFQYGLQLHPGLFLPRMHLNDHLEMAEKYTLFDLITDKDAPFKLFTINNFSLRTDSPASWLLSPL